MAVLAPFACAESAIGDSAVAEAVGRAVDDLGVPPSLVLFFPDGAFDPQQSFREAWAAAADAPLAGMTAAGSLGLPGPISGGCSAIAFGPDAGAGIGICEHASRDPRGAGRAAVRDALRHLERDDRHTLLALLIDTVSGDQSHAIAGAYEVAGPGIPLVGGAAGGGYPRSSAVSSRDVTGSWPWRSRRRRPSESG